MFNRDYLEKLKQYVGKDIQLVESEEAMKDIDAKIGASYGKEIYLKTVTECKPLD